MDMKNSILVILILISFVTTWSQSIPRGMNYQAIARNTNGQILAQENLNIKIYLFSQEYGRRANYYIETHTIQTNALGLFTVIIGEGILQEGEFDRIPWNKENIWLEVAVKNKNQTSFSTVSNSQLMAVPYAIHAGTADRLIHKSPGSSGQFSPPEPGVVSNSWSVFGNAKTDAAGNPYHINALGTTDKIDLIMITDNTERLRILSSGQIITKLNFEIGKNLTVDNNLYVVLSSCIQDTLIGKRNVLLNTMGGATTNYGPFTILNQSPALFTGNLTVDQSVDLDTSLVVEGATDLNGRLFVNNQSPTKLSGTLTVDSVTNIKDSLIVNNISETYFSGTLRGDSCATFNDKIKITSLFSTDTSGAAPSGSLQSGGGAYVSKNLVVGGIAKFGGPAAFAGPVAINDLTQSTSTTTGALKVTGGVGIGLNLNVGQMVMVNGMTTVSDLTESLDSASGALKVHGGVGISKELYVQGNALLSDSMYAQGNINLYDSLKVTSNQSFVAQFRNTNAQQNGIKIQIESASPGHTNNYVEFRKSGGGVVGRIEGENVNEYLTNPEYIRQIAVLQTDLSIADLAVAAATLQLAASVANVVASATSSTVCSGLGVCVTVPITSLIIQAGLDVTARSVALATMVDSKDNAEEQIANFTNYKSAHIGVTYESGAGDYAEWLPKENVEEPFLPGHLIGLVNGKISKKLNGAQKLLVITTKPIVLGNAPAAHLRSAYAKVAFLGQVPVLVMGKVKVGDYIVPSGNDDGFGKAISPADLKSTDYPLILGEAWEEADGSRPYQLVRVAIGIYSNDLTKVIEENQTALENTALELASNADMLKKLIPKYKKASNFDYPPILVSTSSSNRVNSDRMILPASGQDFVYKEISVSHIEQLLKNTENVLQDQAVNLNENPFWQGLKNDPLFKSQFIKSLQQVYKNEISMQIEKWKLKK